MYTKISRALIGRLAATNAIVLAALVILCGPAAASGRYRAVDLGFAGEARAINSHGQVAGEGSLGPDSGGTHGFLWSAGNVTDLGVLQRGQWEYGRATDINDRGQVVGFSVYHGDPEQSAAHAFLWQHGVLTDIDQTSLDSMATAVNNAGQVTGTRYTADGAHAFLWQNGVMTDLGTGYAWDVNDRGQVIGQNQIGGTGATMWYRGRTYDLGAPPGLDDWRPVAINSRGWIAGNGGTMTGRAYLWRAGTFLDLGTLGGSSAFVIDINDRGQVLGLSETTTAALHPFLWHDGRMIDLTTSGGIPDHVTVNSLGEHGEILGTVGDPSAQHAGYYR
jgi:probable HAF family extracellular repeat protein